MAQYATAADIALYSLPASALPASFTDADKNAALAAASAIIDSYIGGRFNLPLVAPYPLDIVICCSDLAAYFLMKRRGFSPEAGDAEQFDKSYDRHLKWLRDVSDGRALPGGGQGAGVVDSNTGSADVRDPTFVVAPASGSLGVSGGTFHSRETDSYTEVGTVGPPKLRGW